MAQSKCRYCGRTFSNGGSCSSSPTKKHVLLEVDGKHCVYCGRTFSSGGSCSSSPTKKHALNI